MGRLVASNVRADFADFEDVVFIGMFGTGYWERVPKDVVVVQESVGGDDDAISQRFLPESPPDDVGARVGRWSIVRILVLL